MRIKVKSLNHRGHTEEVTGGNLEHVPQYPLWLTDFRRRPAIESFIIGNALRSVKPAACREFVRITVPSIG